MNSAFTCMISRRFNPTASVILPPPSSTLYEFSRPRILHKYMTINSGVDLVVLVLWLPYTFFGELASSRASWRRSRVTNGA